jgi:sugar lactone lactonase YvrE
MDELPSLTLLPDDRVLVADSGNNRIRVLSADLQQLSTVADNGEQGHRDGAAAQAQFRCPAGLALLPDSRVLVADWGNHRIRMLSADLQQVSTVAGNDEQGFSWPRALALLPDGCVLVADLGNNRIRVLSADLQQVNTLTNAGELNNPNVLELLPDGWLLVGGSNRIRVLEGFPAALLGTKPPARRPRRRT